MGKYLHIKDAHIKIPDKCKDDLGCAITLLGLYLQKNNLTLDEMNKLYKETGVSEYLKRNNLTLKNKHTNNFLIGDEEGDEEMGYLRLVQLYHRREDLRNQYPFACISYQCMRSQIGNYIKKMSTQKRKPLEAIISLDAENKGFFDGKFGQVGGNYVQF